MTRSPRLPLLSCVLGAATILAVTATPATAGPRTKPTDVDTAESAVVAYFAATAPLWNTTQTANAPHAAQKAIVKAAPAPQSAAAAAVVASTDDWIAGAQATFTESNLSITNTVVTTVVTSTAQAQGEVTSYSDVTTDWTVVDGGNGEVSDASATVGHETVSIGPTVVEDTVMDELSEVPAADDDPQIIETDIPSSDDPAGVTDPPKDLTAQATSRAAGTGPSAVVPMSTRFPQLHYQTMADYAKLWTNTAHAGQEDPNYPTQKDMCASFASQSLHEGGWPYEGGTNRTLLQVWTPDVTGIEHQSYTWARSGELHDRIIQLGGGRKLSDIWSAGVGDLLMVDWNAGTGTVDGKLDHTMIVTGLTSGFTPRISQKTQNRHNIPLSTEIYYAKHSGDHPATVIHWYGIRT